MYFWVVTGYPKFIRFSSRQFLSGFFAFANFCKKIRAFSTSHVAGECRGMRKLFFEDFVRVRACLGQIGILVSGSKEANRGKSKVRKRFNEYI